MILKNYVTLRMCDSGILFMSSVLILRRCMLKYLGEVSLRIQLFKMVHRDFPGGPVVKILRFNAGDVGSIPGQGAKIPHALQAKKSKHKTEAILYQIQ